jgi:hypothetical protein
MIYILTHKKIYPDDNACSKIIAESDNGMLKLKEETLSKDTTNKSFPV